MKENQKTHLNLKDAIIVCDSYDSGEGMFEIKVRCRISDVKGIIVESDGLEVSIKK